jgi:hypothetical protein
VRVEARGIQYQKEAMPVRLEARKPVRGEEKAVTRVG